MRSWAHAWSAPAFKGDCGKRGDKARTRTGWPTHGRGLVAWFPRGADATLLVREDRWTACRGPCRHTSFACDLRRARGGTAYRPGAICRRLPALRLRERIEWGLQGSGERQGAWGGVGAHFTAGDRTFRLMGNGNNLIYLNLRSGTRHVGEGGPRKWIARKGWCTYEARTRNIRVQRLSGPRVKGKGKERR